MIYDGSKTVTTAGTAEALMSTRTPADWVIIQSPYANSGAIYVGASSVSSSRGIELLAGDSVMLPTKANSAMYDLQHVWIDASVSTEGVKFTYGRG